MYWRPPPRWSRWPDLPPDLLREVSARIHHAADFVRFHAVCKPWRDSSSPSRTPATTHLLPWLRAPSSDHLQFLSLRCVFSKTTYRAPRHSSGLRKSLATVDGAAAPYLTTYSPDRLPRLHDYPLAGDVTPLPPLPHGIDRYWWIGNPCGVVYGDGTIFRYKFSDIDRYGNATHFTAALLRPGDAAWTVIDRRLEFPEPGECCAAYHRGNILLTVDASLWHVVTPAAAAAADDVLVPTTSLLGEPDEYFYKYSYVLESRGELLWVSVQVRSGYPGQCGEGVRGLVRAISVTVHELAEEATGGGGEKTVRWVRKDGGSLRDRVLFLGWPSSFAVDAARLGSDDVVTGGCAYFVYKDMEWDNAQDRCCVFRYDLVGGKVKFVEWLPQGWDEDMCSWVVPHHAIAPNQEISHRVDPKWYTRPAVPTPMSAINTERSPVQRYKPCFRVFLRNLPLTVDASRLRCFLSKHGQVADAQVICCRDTGISQGLGLVTMAMVDEQDDAVAALDGLILDGCSLEASLVKKRRRRRRRTSSTRAGQHK